MADLGTDNFEQEFTLSLLQNQEQALGEITEALERIRRGTFGCCEECQEAISKARLQRLALYPSLRRVCTEAPTKFLKRPMPERSYRVLLWALALVGLALDQSSKYGVFAWLAEKPEHEYVLFRTDNGGFQLVAQFERDSLGVEALDAAGQRVPHVNQGALFGFLRDHKALANGGFALISLLAAAAIVYWSTHRTTARDRWLCSALGLILAGTLGNFYDRVVFNGVRDFLHWNYLFDWPVFNVADCCLVCGAFLLLIQAFATQPAKDEPISRSITTENTESTEKDKDRKGGFMASMVRDGSRP